MELDFDVSLLYKDVFEQVMEYARKQFIEESVDEAVIQKLEELWLGKLNNGIKAKNEELLGTNLVPVIEIMGNDSDQHLAKDYSASNPNETQEITLFRSPSSTGNESPNSDDDIQEDVGETNNIILCKYESVKRKKNAWKMNLHSGMMNLYGKEYVFGIGFGEAMF